MEDAPIKPERKKEPETPMADVESGRWESRRDLRSRMEKARAEYEEALKKFGARDHAACDTDTSDMTTEGGASVKGNLSANIEGTIARAVEVIGSRNQAMRWLGMPVRALDFATPISLLGTEEGVAQVMDVLGQMEHGVW